MYKFKISAKECDLQINKLELVYSELTEFKLTNIKTEIINALDLPFQGLWESKRKIQLLVTVAVLRRCPTVTADHQSRLGWMVCHHCTALPKERWFQCKLMEHLFDCRDTGRKVSEKFDYSDEK